jgi:hypothetical protein
MDDLHLEGECLRKIYLYSKEDLKVMTRTMKMQQKNAEGESLAKSQARCDCDGLG